MTKLTVPMLIIAALLCSCATHSAVAGKTTYESTRFNGQQPNRHDTRIATRSTQPATRLQGQSVTSHARTAATTRQHPVEQNRRTIDAFVITGNARMPTAKIQSALKQYRGEHKTATDVSNAMRRVIDLYSSSGLNGAIVTKKDHVVVLHVIESSINAGTGGGGPDSAGRHFTTEIKASPVVTGTAQATVKPADAQASAAFPDAAVRTPAITTTRFIIKGNHRISTQEILQVLKPYAEGRFSRAKLFMSRLSLVDLYESKGLRHVAIGLPADLRNPVTLTIFENDIQQTSVATTPHRATTARLSSGWVRLGWQQMGRGNTAQAMAIWQQGVNRMPPDQLLAYIGVYIQASAAIRRLKHIGLRHAAIMLKTSFHGKPAYYVMAALPVPANKALRRKKLAGLRRAMGGHGNIFATSAGKFQTAAGQPY